MQKIEIIGLITDSKRIIERLQRRGIVELYRDSENGLESINPAASLSQFERSKASCEQALAILDRCAPQKQSLLSGFTEDKQSVEIHDFGKKAAELEQNLQLAYRILAADKSIRDANSEIARLQTQADALRSWEELDIPLGFRGTEKTACLIGTLPGLWTQEQAAQRLFAPSDGEADADDALPALDPAQTVCHVVCSAKEQSNLAVFCHKDILQAVTARLQHHGFTPLENKSDCTARQLIAVCREKIGAQEQLIAEKTEWIEQQAPHRQDLCFFIDYLTMRRDKYESLANLSLTEKTFVVNGYVPEKYASRLRDELERHYTCAVTLCDPDPDEDVPVKLENRPFSAPVEGITEMYALPAKHDIDPTPVMSFFYYFFFGLMLSDAGYGLVMVIGTMIALKKLKLSDKMRRSLRMFRNCGISTVVWGALFGSWFGDAIPVIAEQFFGKTVHIPCWFEPIADPVRLLLYSFAFGVVHLFVGLGVHFWLLWKDGKKWDALCDTIPIYLTVLGVLPFGAGILVDTVPAMLNTIGGYVALIGVILLIATSGRSAKNIVMKFLGGLYGLYNAATGYLGDILSYSRLLALGLATGSIAGVVNMIGTMPQNMVLKTILFVVVFLFGHTLNLAINLLGAYVHTSRLQFVEMFSKFYEGGGRAFEPLQSSTKYIKLTEDTNHE